MRTHVVFKHPAEFIGNDDDGGGVLDVCGSEWFVTLLQRIPNLEIAPEPLKEDWGVVFYVRHNQMKFWIGLSAWDHEGSWLAHLHYGLFSWFQRIGSSGEKKLDELSVLLHRVLENESVISEVSWYEASELEKPHPVGFQTPS